MQDIKSAVHLGLASHHVPVVPRCTLELTWQLQCTRLCMQLDQSKALSMFGVGTMDAGDGLLATQIGMGCQFRLRAFTRRRVQEWLAQSRGNI